ATACYPLKETKRLLGGAASYAPTLDPAGLADACLTLMQEDSLRARRATEAARLSAETFIWENEARKYVGVYERVLKTMSADCGQSRLDGVRRVVSSDRDRDDAGGHAHAQLRRRGRLHQDRAGADRALRSRRPQRPADGAARRGDCAGDGGRGADVGAQGQGL